ncbi:hypothetical protein ACIQSO_21820 [Pseudomonas putida]|uniref:hypothetical protein n=1 Tax=Pseudomonas putida TaxID=303 RepID=UPI00383BD209
MTKHKPGPWVIDEKGLEADPGKLSIAVGDGEYFICQVDGGMHQMANAKLIAAAPRLLDDLIDAAAQLRAYEILHRAKGTDDSLAKADVNADLASRFERTIAAATA